MILFLGIPIGLLILSVFNILIILGMNDYLLPYLGFEYSVNFLQGYFITIFLICIYFMFFTKKVESSKFRDYLYSDLNFFREEKRKEKKNKNNL